MEKAYRFVIPLLLAWLLGWMVLTWPAIQDDALIHLRYADHLLRFHFITYDGVHPDYGASSLLYVALLAMLRKFSASANLARGVSSADHLLLFAALAWGFWWRAERWDKLTRLAALILLVLVVSPSAVRWLDDGMETGMVTGFASGLAWMLHDESVKARKGVGPGVLRFAAMVSVGFLTVMLRTELSLVCGVGFLLLLPRLAQPRKGGLFAAIWSSLHLPLGALLALGFIYAEMHVVLPDTALAKSHGIAYWFNPIHDTAITLGGAMSFGLGLLIFWLLTLGLVVERQGVSGMLVFANCFFPLVLVLASLRGQEIQGVRYFAWTFFFAIVWNTLELGNHKEAKSRSPGGRWTLYGFLLLLACELPFETVAMHRVLTSRAATMREFEREHLEVLSDARGVASDIGYIGYFTGAKLCDLAGLVNGRTLARLSSRERTHDCALTEPQFLFLNAGQLGPLTPYRDFSKWQVCGRYDFTNLSTRDSHYLIVQPEIASEVCRSTGQAPQPLTSLRIKP